MIAADGVSSDAMTTAKKTRKPKPPNVPEIPEPTVAREEWQTRARCRSNPHFANYPVKFRKAYCGGCKVQEQCEAAGLYQTTSIAAEDQMYATTAA